MEGAQMDEAKWSGIEEYELDPTNWVQLGFRFVHDGDNMSGQREYRIIAMVNGESFSNYWDTKDGWSNKNDAYTEYYKTQEKLLAQ
jgi:hypothetical protein